MMALDHVMYARRIREFRALIGDRDTTIDGLKDQLADARKLLLVSMMEIEGKQKEVSRLMDTYDSMYSTMLDMNHGLEVDVKVAGEDVEGLEAELSVRKQDSSVLMAVGALVSKWDKTPPAYRSSHLDMRAICTLIEDYVVDLKFLGLPIVPHPTPCVSVGDDVMMYKRTIVGLKETIRDLRLAGGDMLDTIDECSRRVAKVEGTKLKLKLSGAEVVRLRRILGVVDRELEELTGLYCARCDQLEKIVAELDEVKGGNLSAYATAADNIVDIIMEK